MHPADKRRFRDGVPDHGGGAWDAGETIGLGRTVVKRIVRAADRTETTTDGRVTKPLDAATMNGIERTRARLLEILGLEEGRARPGKGGP